MTDVAGETIESRGIRADARRNREQIIAAAREIFVAQGPDVPLEEIARRAGVGIATLYRRFPDRRALMRAVALDALAHVAEEIRLATAEEPDAFRALARYMQRVLDLRVSAVMPMLAGRISLDEEEIFSARQQSTALIQGLIDRAQADGTLRSDVTFGDISLLLIRLGRPLPGPFPPDVADALAQRHLALFLDALRTLDDGPSEPLPGPALTLADLRSLRPAHERPADSESPDKA
jgi:AcrR family transcriptional regulator